MLLRILMMAAVLLQFGCGAEAETPAQEAKPVDKAVALASESSNDVSVEDVVAKAQAAFTKINPQIKVLSAKPLGVAGLFVVQVDGAPEVYMDASASFFITGQQVKLMQFEGEGMVDVIDQLRSVDRLAALKTVDDSKAIVFPAKGEQKAEITVFTDVDCYYCQKLHAEVPALNEGGIKVRYLAFPRAGVGSPTYQKMVSAWCSDNKQLSITELKAKKSIPSKVCETEIAQQYQLGKSLGVSGTPAILLEDGTLIPGYRPAADLIKELAN